MDLPGAGAWDGQDRLALTHLIGWHLPVDGDAAHPYRVLGRWLALPHSLILDRVRQAALAATSTPVGAATICQFTANPVVAAAVTLEELENNAYAVKEQGEWP